MQLFTYFNRYHALEEVTLSAYIDLAYDYLRIPQSDRQSSVGLGFACIQTPCSLKGTSKFEEAIDLVMGIGGFIRARGLFFSGLRDLLAQPHAELPYGTQYYKKCTREYANIKID